jgi:hypothetical protein
MSELASAEGQIREEMLNKIPAGRIGEPGEIAEPVAPLLLTRRPASTVPSSPQTVR